MIVNQNFFALELSAEWARTKMITSVSGFSDPDFWGSEGRHSFAYFKLEGFLPQGFHDFLCLFWVGFPSSESELDLATLAHSGPKSWTDRGTAGWCCGGTDLNTGC